MPRILRIAPRHCQADRKSPYGGVGRTTTSATPRVNGSPDEHHSVKGAQTPPPRSIWTDRGDAALAVLTPEIERASSAHPLVAPPMRLGRQGVQPGAPAFHPATGIPTASPLSRQHAEGTSTSQMPIDKRTRLCSLNGSASAELGAGRVRLRARDQPTSTPPEQQTFGVWFT
jgi:hypothetical protein